jgi:hypothetical protein
LRKCLENMRQAFIGAIAISMLVVYGPGALAAAAIDPTRVTAYDWACQDAAGTVLSNHQQQHTAIAACANRALADGKAYFIQGGRYRITVSGSAAPPAPANRPPTITGTPASTATVGSAYSFTPTGSDPDGQAVTYAIANKPAWAAFSTATGVLSGVPAAAGLHAGIVISISDGQATAALQFQITVTAASTPGPTPAPTPGPNPVIAPLPITWSAPLVNTDGTPITGAICYRLEWGKGAFDRIVNTCERAVTIPVAQLSIGTWQFRVITIVAGRESDPSATGYKLYQ